MDADSRHADGMKEIVYYITRCHYAPRKNYFANVDASILKMTCNERKDGYIFLYNKLYASQQILFFMLTV